MKVLTADLAAPESAALSFNLRVRHTAGCAEAPGGLRYVCDVKRSYASSTGSWSSWT
jgi:hypothetical protein